jgi:hypothetical protein
LFTRVVPLHAPAQVVASDWGVQHVVTSQACPAVHDDAQLMV